MSEVRIIVYKGSWLLQSNNGTVSDAIPVVPKPLCNLEAFTPISKHQQVCLYYTLKLKAFGLQLQI